MPSEPALVVAATKERWWPLLAMHTNGSHERFSIEQLRDRHGLDEA